MRLKFSTMKCKPGKHNDRLMKGRKRLECLTCQDKFPCLVACDHLDCIAERQVPGSMIKDELGFDNAYREGQVDEE